MTALYRRHGVPGWNEEPDPMHNKDRFYLSGYAHGVTGSKWLPAPAVPQESQDVWRLGYEDGLGDAQND